MVFQPVQFVANLSGKGYKHYMLILQAKVIL